MNSKVVLFSTTNSREHGGFMRISCGFIAIIAAIIASLVAGCGGSTAAPPPPPPPPPPPAGVTVSPPSATVQPGGVQQFTATVTPSGANPAVTWSVSGTSCAGASCGTIASTGKYTAPATAPNPSTVMVIATAVADPTKAAHAAVTIGNPVPSIGLLSPSGAAAGGPAFTLTVFGSDFFASSVVQWNGSDRPTTFVSSNELTAQISVSDIAVTGTTAVTVFNPAPGGGSSTTSTFTIATGGVSPTSVAVDPTGKFAYVTNYSSNNVSMFSISTMTGALTPIERIDAGLSPSSVAVHPSGNFAYVTNSVSNNVSMYSIDAATGVLASIGPPVAAADVWPRSVAVDPTGEFAYVANGGGDEPGATFNGSVAMYTINAMTGALTSTGTIEAPCAPPPSPGSCAPISVAVHPSGKFAYVANEGGFSPTSVSMYTINATTGALGLIGTIATAGRAISVVVDPSGRFAYVANSDSSNDISMYTVNASTGALTSIGLITAGLVPNSVAIDPSGRFVYVTNFRDNNVSMYSIDAATGALSSIGTIPTGLSPTSVAVHPSGKFAYVTNSGSSNVSMYSIDIATGALTLIGTIGT